MSLNPYGMPLQKLVAVLEALSFASIHGLPHLEHV